ncbi:MAG: SpoIID/LytB domain-containing protein [Chloroflexota bacterium]
MYETEAFYEKIGWWIERTAQVIKDQAPDMKLVIPPFSPGRHEDGAPNDHGQITEAFAGYDYLADTLETYFGSRIAYHAYWGDANGSYQDRLYDGQVSQWYAFRWRRLLKMFEERYGIQGRVIIDEASNYAAYDLDLFDQLTYFSQEALSDGRVLGLSYYLWEDPTFSPGNIFNVWTQYILDMASFTQRLSAIPDVSITKPAPPSNSAISTQSLPSGNPVNATSTVSTASTVSTTAAHDSQFDGITIRVSFEDGRITPMPLESYLRAVVPAEMPALWHPEALKAQAVAARTYAMRSLMRSRSQNKEADITSTFAHSQQFDPSKMHAAADVAILATKGLVLRQNGQIIDALFSANCGGHTRNNEDVDGFSKTPVPYLRGVSCPNPGPKNGHGLGLCQHGARAFAEQGLTYDQILAHYYTNTTLDPMPSV